MLTPYFSFITIAYYWVSQVSPMCCTIALADTPKKNKTTLKQVVQKKNQLKNIFFNSHYSFIRLKNIYLSNTQVACHTILIYMTKI